MKKIFELSAVEQAKLLSSEQISSLELTKLYLDRIETFNPELGAFSFIAYKQACRDAKYWDSKQIKPSGELSGIPIGIKDLSMVRWMPAQMGSRSYRYFVSPIDDPNVRRIRRAGLIIIGKTTTSEFGATPFSPARNPYNLSLTAGGSSGGAAAAVAAKLLPLAHAADGGGSIRIPAALCGLIGFKPSRGAIHHTMLPDRLRLVTEGPIARYLEDIRAFLKILATNPVDFERTSLPKRCRVIFHTHSPLTATHPEIQQAVRETACQLERAGHIVEERPWPNLAFEDFSPLWTRTIANIPILKESSLEPITRHFRKEGKKVSHRQILAHRALLTSRLSQWWGTGVDFHLAPSTACLAPVLPNFQSLSIDESIQAMLPLGAYTPLANVMGYAAMSLPLAKSLNGLPIGVQIIAPQGHDAQLLELAAQCCNF